MKFRNLRKLKREIVNLIYRGSTTNYVPISFTQATD